MTHATSGDNRIDLAALYICAASPSGSAPSRPRATTPWCSPASNWCPH